MNSFWLKFELLEYISSDFNIRRYLIYLSACVRTYIQMHMTTWGFFHRILVYPPKVEVPCRYRVLPLNKLTVLLTLISICPYMDGHVSFRLVPFRINNVIYTTVAAARVYNFHIRVSITVEKLYFTRYASHVKNIVRFLKKKKLKFLKNL